MSWTRARSRRAGAAAGRGRKRAADVDPELLPALLALVEPEKIGDPMSLLRWTTKSTLHLAGELTRQSHHRISAHLIQSNHQPLLPRPVTTRGQFSGVTDSRPGRGGWAWC